MTMDQRSTHAPHEGRRVHKPRLVPEGGDPAGSTLWSDTGAHADRVDSDVLLDVTNPGLWMAHSYIAEHHEGGMMFSFDVTE
jgi:FtsP/CotA-like multicopper oxidase with cupredoxin domain